MIASIIAYFMVIFFVISGVVCVVPAVRTATPAPVSLWLFAASIVFFVSAWGCAYLGGI
jgi:hypothetical protein